MSFVVILVLRAASTCNCHPKCLPCVQCLRSDAAKEEGSAGEAGAAGRRRDATTATVTAEVEVVCSICTETMADAAELPCAHAFCYKCIIDNLELSLRGQGKCPMCRKATKASDVERSRVLERLAANVEGTCAPGAAHGCKYKGRRDALRAHEKACPKMPGAAAIAALRAEYEAKLAAMEKEKDKQDKQMEEKDEQISDLESVVERMEAEMRRARAVSKSFQISVTGTFGASTTPLDVLSHTTIWGIKTVLQDVFGPPATMRLYISAAPGEYLENDRSVASYGITAGATLRAYHVQ